MQNFWNKVRKTRTCWLWTAALRGSTGYGAIGLNGKTWSAHRLSFLLHNGFLPIVVMHKCDVRACVRPSHLVAGDYRMNALDAVRKGRMHAPIGYRFKPGHKTHNRILTTKAMVRKMRRAIKTRTVSLVKLAEKLRVPVHLLKDLSSGRTY